MKQAVLACYALGVTALTLLFFTLSFCNVAYKIEVTWNSLSRARLYAIPSRMQ